MEINVEIISPEKAIVNADIKRIEQVLYNLIINAINHVGKDNKVIIKVAENESNYLIEVIDHGKGIKKEDIKFIFKRYYKVDKKYRRDKKGSGIGLSIVESILKRHGFKYGVKSKVSEGTTFYFEVSK
jgi:signal transduction histidine kinase